MSGAVFTDISQVDLRMEVTRQFPFLHADGTRWTVIKSSDGGAVVFELIKLAAGESSFQLSICEVQPPKQKTIIDRKDAPDMMCAYNRSGILDRQILILDPVYANVVANEPTPPTITNISLAPPDPKCKLECPLAIVSSAGVCEVRGRKDDIRRYDHVLVNVSEMWENQYSAKSQKNYDSVEDLTKYYSNLIFTVTCWTNSISEDNQRILFCGTRSGLIFTISISASNSKILSVTESDVKPLNFLKYFSFGDQNENEFLFAASIAGVCKVFRRVGVSELKEVATLWGVKDKMAFHCVEVHYDKDKNQIVAVASKGSHFLAFILTPEGELLQKATHYVGNLVITGIQQLEGNQFIICTINSHTMLVTINTASTPIQIESNEIKNDLDSKCYEVLGMVTTTNRVAWIFLQFPINLFEHAFKSPTMLTICSLNVKDALETMQLKVDSRFCEFADCAEVVRCTYLKFGLPDAPPYDIFTEDTFNNKFIRQLKILAIVLAARISYFKKKQRSEDMFNTQKEINNVRKVLEVHMAYRRLSHLATLKEFTRVQKISSAYFRNKMIAFCQDDSIEWMQHVRQGFVQRLSDLLKRTEGFNQAECEQCILCDDYINLATGACKNNHQRPKCCITFLQVPLFGAIGCESCQYAAINDANLLKQVLSPDEPISCPLCDGPLTGAKTLIYFDKPN